MINYQAFIEIDSNIRFGKPVIIGTRITVYDVLKMFASGMKEEEIIDDFPQLSKEHLRACLLFASDKERHLAIAL